MSTSPRLTLELGAGELAEGRASPLRGVRRERRFESGRRPSSKTLLEIFYPVNAQSTRVVRNTQTSDSEVGLGQTGSLFIGDFVVPNKRDSVYSGSLPLPPMKIEGLSSYLHLEQGLTCRTRPYISNEALHLEQNLFHGPFGAPGDREALGKGESRVSPRPSCPLVLWSLWSYSLSWGPTVQALQDPTQGPFNQNEERPCVTPEFFRVTYLPNSLPPFSSGSLPTYFPTHLPIHPPIHYVPTHLPTHLPTD